MKTINLHSSLKRTLTTLSLFFLFIAAGATEYTPAFDENENNQPTLEQNIDREVEILIKGNNAAAAQGGFTNAHSNDSKHIHQTALGTPVSVAGNVSIEKMLGL